MTDEILDKRSIGVADDQVRLRHDTETFRDQAQQIKEETQRIRDDAVDKSAASALAAHTSAVEAAQSAVEAHAWVNAGQGISIGPEEPAVKKQGHVWMHEESQARIPLYPGPTTYPGAAVYPERPGQEATGSGTIDRVSRWDSDHWKPFTFAPSLTNQ